MMQTKQKNGYIAEIIENICQTCARLKMQSYQEMDHLYQNDIYRKGLKVFRNLFHSLRSNSMMDDSSEGWMTVLFLLLFFFPDLGYKVILKCWHERCGSHCKLVNNIIKFLGKENKQKQHTLTKKKKKKLPKATMGLSEVSQKIMQKLMWWEYVNHSVKMWRL